MLREAICGVVLLCMSAGNAFADDLCHLTAADKIANAKLSFDEFDQKGVSPSTWRALEKAGCHTKAVEAADDYLVNGPPQTPGIKSDILFHEAQSLAMAGDNAGAAHYVAAAIPPDRASHGDLDWTTYLIGTWAFLVKDRTTLGAATKKMMSEPGDDNHLDGAVLRGLSNCFDKSYEAAYDDCRPK
jgi:hypothetical protein